MTHIKQTGFVLLLCIFWSLCLTSMAQQCFQNKEPDPPKESFCSFLDGERSHKMVHCMIDGAYECNYEKTSTEVINNIEYYRFDGDSNFGYPPFSLFLREDTVSGKLWVYDEIEEREWLAIDMGLELNDSLLLSSRYANYYDTIAFVDSVFYDNEGRKHLRFNLSCFNFALSPNYNKLEFIDGIGTNFGLGYQVINPIDYFYQEILLCAFKDDEKVYSHNSESGDSCKLIINGVGIENIYQSGLKVWPNPCQKTVKVNPPFGYFGYGTILIRDIAGKLVYSKSFQCFEFGIAIDMSLFKPGIYFIETKLNNHKVYLNKLIRLL